MPPSTGEADRHTGPAAGRTGTGVAYVLQNAPGSRRGPSLVLRELNRASCSHVYAAIGKVRPTNPKTS